MSKRITIVLIIAWWLVERANAQDFIGPDTVFVQSGELALKGLLWRPYGHGPFLTVIFCAGSYGGADTIHNPEHDVSLLGRCFPGMVIFFLLPFEGGLVFRRTRARTVQT